MSDSCVGHSSRLFSGKQSAQAPGINGQLHERLLLFFPSPGLFRPQALLSRAKSGGGAIVLDLQTFRLGVNAVDVRVGSSAGQQFFQPGAPLHDELVHLGRAQFFACQYDLALRSCDEAFRQDTESLTPLAASLPSMGLASRQPWTCLRRSLRLVATVAISNPPEKQRMADRPPIRPMRPRQHGAQRNSGFAESCRA